MPNLPGSGLTVIVVCGIGLAFVLGFAAREFRFLFHRRRGIELFKEQDYHAALRHLVRAERLWMLRLSKQTMSSRAEDCKNLGVVLDLISQVAGYCSVKIETKEYREAANELELFFSIGKKNSGNYPEIYSAFRELQKQFRSSVRKIRA